MNRPSLLQTYRAIREIIVEVRQATEALDEHIGRAQIFGTREDLDRAMGQALTLQGKVKELELQLRRCSPTDHIGQALSAPSVESVPTQRALPSKS